MIKQYEDFGCPLCGASNDIYGKEPGSWSWDTGNTAVQTFTCLNCGQLYTAVIGPRMVYAVEDDTSTGDKSKADPEIINGKKRSEIIAMLIDRHYSGESREEILESIGRMVYSTVSNEDILSEYIEEFP